MIIFLLFLVAMLVLMIGCFIGMLQLENWGAWWVALIVSLVAVIFWLFLMPPLVDGSSLGEVFGISVSFIIFAVWLGLIVRAFVFAIRGIREKGTNKKSLVAGQNQKTSDDI